jgi:predicted PhzF superfamily epimerase YddE/YHI9
MTKAIRTIEKISARAFSQLEGGGNPVVIFATAQGLTNATQQRLAQTCECESVVVNRHLNQLSFFIPTGEQVSFCAHGAIGGAMQLAGPLTDKTESFVQFCAVQQNAVYHATRHDRDIMSLQMTTPWTEAPIIYPPALHRILRISAQLQRSDVTSVSDNAPTFCNAATGRPKTLVYIRSLEALEKAHVPYDDKYFKKACDSLQSTGICLYTECPGDDRTKLFECRQLLPGYLDDPTTGVTALAASIDHRQLKLRGMFSNAAENQLAVSSSLRYLLNQVTAKGQTSLTMVENLQWTKSLSSNDNGGDANSDISEEIVSFRLVGRVEVDSHEFIEVDDDGDT